METATEVKRIELSNNTPCVEVFDKKNKTKLGSIFSAMQKIGIPCFLVGPYYKPRQIFPYFRVEGEASIRTHFASFNRTTPIREDAWTEEKTLKEFLNLIAHSLLEKKHPSHWDGPYICDNRNNDYMTLWKIIGDEKNGFRLGDSFEREVQ